MTPDNLSTIADLVRRRSGVVVDTDKTYVIETRLGPIARREGFTSIGEMITELQTTREELLSWSVVEAMPSSETQFFRDKTPFEQLRHEILPALAKTRGGEARLWSLGCATGQEAYSIAILAEEGRDAYPGLKIDILASDLSERWLEKARSGLYTQFEVQHGLPSRLLVKYFDKLDDAWILAPRIRQTVRFERANVLADVKGAGPFDVILCRNVLSAFDDSTRRSVLTQLAGALADGGHLILGLNEMAAQPTPGFRPVPGRRGLYIRDPDFRAAA